MKLLRFLVLPCCLVATVEAIAREAPATPEERKAAAQIYTDCHVANALKLDDGVSDAGTIGEAVALTCRPEMEEFARVMTKEQKRDRVRLMLIERMGSRAANEATLALLMVRQKMKSANANAE